MDATDKILVGVCKNENEIYSEFIPKEASEKEVTLVIHEFIDENPNANIGLVMNELKNVFGISLNGQKAQVLARNIFARNK